MANSVLLLGVRTDVLPRLTQELQAPGIDFLSGTGAAMLSRRFTRQILIM